MKPMFDELKAISDFTKLIGESTKEKFRIEDLVTFVIKREDISITENMGIDKEIIRLISKDYEYTCFLGFSEKQTDIVDFLKKFLCKDVTLHNTPINIQGSKRYLYYWGDGELVQQGKYEKSTKEKSDIKAENKQSKIPVLNTKTRLPKWLDDYIFESLDAKYEPNFEMYRKNKDLKEAGIKTYLGTYFPRSFSESFCIFSNLFSSNNMFKFLTNKKQISILGFGSGLGGDLLGLLSAINKYCKKKLDLKIISIDANKYALHTQKKIICKYSLFSKHKIKLIPIKKTLTEEKDLLDFFKRINGKFDFILSAKCISEILSEYGNRFRDGYEIFALQFSKFINEKGLILILDITEKLNCQDWLPIKMNREINRFLNSSSGFASLIPIPCYIYQSKCTDGCYTQQQFLVSHSKRAYNISKVSYRIIGRTEFVNNFLGKKPQINYIIKWKYDNINQKTDNGCCMHTEQIDKFADAYKL